MTVTGVVQLQYSDFLIIKINQINQLIKKVVIRLQI